MMLTLGIFRPEEKEIELTSSRLTPLPGGGNRRCGIGDAGWASGREGGRGGGRGGGFFQFGGRLGGAKIPFLARIAGWASGLRKAAAAWAKLLGPGRAAWAPEPEPCSESSLAQPLRRRLSRWAPAPLRGSGSGGGAPCLREEFNLKHKNVTSA